ncbi:YgaP family membrane protein [Sagittula salina]|uniref:DUF2892 domain-containing protein n=1 Tax=Sagittula salina TaxID=2820268 RepID=A0A940S1T0_9RHOB|nr:DUF2892 domain-containing protein [Sagittula salina]MBP0480875.1 DUF2892 domain-containing protein [Sagittula salina]
MTRNMGQLDRIIRAAIGIFLLILVFTSLSGAWAWIAGIIGVAMLTSSAFGICPPYALFGINTCRIKG